MRLPLTVAMGADRDDDAGAVAGPTGTGAPGSARADDEALGRPAGDDRTLAAAANADGTFPDPSAGPLLVLYQQADGRLALRWRLDPGVLAGARAAFNPAARPAGELRLRRGAEVLLTRPIALEASATAAAQGAAAHGPGAVGECVVAGVAGALHAELGLVADGGWMLVARSNRLDAAGPVGADFLHGTGDAPAVAARPGWTSTRTGYGPLTPTDAAGRALADPPGLPAAPPASTPPTSAPPASTPPASTPVAAVGPVAAAVSGAGAGAGAATGAASAAASVPAPVPAPVPAAGLARHPDSDRHPLPSRALPGPFPLWRPGARGGAGAPLAVTPGVSATASLPNAVAPDVTPGPPAGQVWSALAGPDLAATAPPASSGRAAPPADADPAGEPTGADAPLADRTDTRPLATRGLVLPPPAHGTVPASALASAAAPATAGSPAPTATPPAPGSGPVSSPREALDPSLYAQLTVYGRAAPGSLLDLGGHAYRVGPGGRFVLALPVGDRALILRLLGQLTELPVAPRDDDPPGGGASG